MKQPSVDKNSVLLLNKYTSPESNGQGYHKKIEASIKKGFNADHYSPSNSVMANTLQP